jgi:hypothetical protein
MRKIKTKGLKFKVKPVDRGPRYALSLQNAPTPRRAKEALQNVFDVNDALADSVVKAAPVVLIKDLDLEEATRLRDRMKSAGDVRVWLESAALRMKQMNLKLKEIGAPAGAEAEES